MPELHDLLERRAADYQPPEDLLVRVRERGRQRERNRRAGTALAALLVVAVAVGGLVRLVEPEREVFFDQPTNPWSGTWVSTDSDGSSQTMDIHGLEGGTYEVVVADAFATACAGAPSTMTGTGRIDSTGLILPTPKLTCDDGSTPETSDGSSLGDALRDYTLVRDAETDTLSDNLDVTWRRPAATPQADATDASADGGMWPQSTLDEMRKAQERADAGDPEYAWQVDPALAAERNVVGAEIFARFLTEELGWEELRYVGSDDDGVGLSEEGGGSVADSYSMTFARCAVKQANLLYPKDSGARNCAPTIDAFTYAAVQVSIVQPLGPDPDGIWVVRSWQRQEPVRQAVPPSDAEVAQLVEPLLQARADGQGAEEYVKTAAAVPLLYSTSTGARYERFAYDAKTVWPSGTVVVNVRLFADGGDTVVERKFIVQHGRQTLMYDGGGTTENGREVASLYTVLDGQVTFSVPAALESWQGLCCFTPGGEDMEGVQGYLSDFANEFVVVVDPLPPAGIFCVGEDSVSADELVRAIRSSPYLSVTADAARVGGTDAVRLDVTAGDEPSPCSHPEDVAENSAALLAPRATKGDSVQSYGINTDNRARVYVFDLPGNPTRTAAIVIRGPKSTFDKLLEGARPILDSLEVHPG